ncbi:septum formation family protein [Nesterenkonia pannonica]|uniref:septum formation family protein n=1 Tax=Nesterenkonia pannonica TaxID=1548602 RepID=UPI00216429B9|nr:septum formation family protein [Nesterenkonia pannonica]
MVGYEDEDEPADVVDCERPYDVQVVLRQNISDGAYPGDVEVADTAHEWCHDDLRLDEETAAEAEHDLAVRLWHPTESTWDDGDRLVSCFLTRSDDGPLTGDFVLDEEEQEDEDGDAEADVSVSADPRDDEADDADAED